MAAGLVQYDEGAPGSVVGAATVDDDPASLVVPLHYYVHDKSPVSALEGYLLTRTALPGRPATADSVAR